MVKWLRDGYATGIRADDGRHFDDLSLVIGHPPTRRCVTTVFCVNAKVLWRRICPLSGVEVAESGFSHIVEVPEVPELLATANGRNGPQSIASWLGLGTEVPPTTKCGCLACRIALPSLRLLLRLS